MTTHEHTNQTDAATTLPVPEETLSLSDLAQTLSKELGLNSGQIARTIALLDEGNTIPFISRYRKEVTSSLDEVQIQSIADRSASLRALHERKLDVHRLIDTQGKMTPELAASIAAATTLREVEDWIDSAENRRPRAEQPNRKV